MAPHLALRMPANGAQLTAQRLPALRGRNHRTGTAEATTGLARKGAASVFLEVPSSYLGPDGKWVHHFRQSDVTRFRQCPELHRLAVLGTMPERENDSAAVGTAMHAGAEEALREILDDGEADWDTCLQLAIESWFNAWHSDTFNVTEIASIGEGANLVAGCLERWWDLVLMPELLGKDILATEQRFNVVAYEDDARVIRLAGTQDCWTADHIYDWKSSNRTYSGKEAWKYQRGYSSVQHVLYAWARLLIEGTEPSLVLAWDIDLPLYGFTYVVLPRNPGKDGLPELDRLTIVPTAGDAQFLFAELMSLALLIEARLPHWPLGPSDWWCSNKWCPNWDNCRGKVMAPDPWGLMAKVELGLSKKRK